MDLWLGTSGYSYPDWVGSFYPPRTPSSRMFAHYMRHFPLVELNYTFYRMPAAKDLERLGRQSPPAFQFLVKLHQSVSHDGNVAAAAEFQAALAPLRQMHKLLGVLAQFPQRFHDEPGSRALLERLAERFTGDSLAVEFRHRSWAKSELPGWLGTRGLSLVSVDVPEIPALYPTGLVQSSRLFYVRLHSRRASAWYEGDKERYDYSYSDAELTEWLERLSARADDADRALVLFNNCHRGQAAVSAARMQALVSRYAPRLTLVPPFVEAAERQASLFE